MFFFFKQKTAYEIKECDWSSDVCSSDLVSSCGADTADGNTTDSYTCVSGESKTNVTDVAKGTPSIPPDGGSEVDTWYSRTITCEAFDEPFHKIEIGRASCRERV